MTTTDYRLQHHVIPSDYDVTIDSAPNRATFHGSVIVSAKIKRATDIIEFHARDLKLEGAVVKQGSKRFAAKIRIHKDRETAELVLDKTLAKGEVTITVNFKGKLNPSLHGLYLGADGTERAICSQCEATDARAIFPCMDEPSFKATLKWTVHTVPGLVVITNGALEKKKKSKTTPVREIHTFARTKVIPTYLAAITIGKYECGIERTIAKIPCSIWAGEGKGHQTQFAMEVTEQVLPWYQKYFGQKYNYDKLDQVAVAGFDAGAMENVGAIFYRQSLLLMQPGAVSWMGQKRIAEVIAHEIAHQWFGNLVTMAWWDDLWLNEAFATWISFKAVAEWQPEWRMWDDFLGSKESAMVADALVSTHPVYTDVKSPAEATELFDVITYEKGCAILRMIENYLGAEVFQKGIQAYQKAFRNKNATGPDLWGKLTESSGQPVDRLMQSWVIQPGFPVLETSLEQSASNSILHVSQKRFFADPKQNASGETWMIPMVIVYGDAQGVHRTKMLFETKQGTIKLHGKNVLWAYANVDATGFYRLKMSPDTLNALLTHGLKHLSPGERKSLLDDQWALAKAGEVGIDAYLNVLEALADERDHIVLESMTGQLNALVETLAGDEDRPGLEALIQRLLSPQLHELGFERGTDEHPSMAMRRALVLSTLGGPGADPAIRKRCTEFVEQECKAPEGFDPDLAGTVINIAAIQGDKRMFTRYMDTYQTRRDQRMAPQISARYLHGMAHFEHPTVLKLVLEACLDGSVPQDQLRVLLVPLLCNPRTGRTTWAFMKKNWDALSPRVGSMSLSRLIEATGRLPIPLKSDVEKFFKQHPVPEATRAMHKAIEAFDLREQFIMKQQPVLRAWLETRDAA